LILVSEAYKNRNKQVLKIVICDDVDNGFQESGELSRLEASAVIERYAETALQRWELINRLRGAFAAVAIRDRTVLDRQLLHELPDLRLIAYSGPHRIDVPAATEMGIVVVGTPGTSTPSVAEHVFGMIFALARAIPQADYGLRHRHWNSRAGMELEGKTLGILGLGRTGGAVAKRAGVFGLHVIAWGPTLTAERASASGVKIVSEEELFRASDILSVHLRRSDWSRGFVNAARLNLMKPTAYLIDISWDGIVDHHAVAKALADKKIAGAALDLCGTDPVDMNDPILDAPNTVLTPHLAWQTKESYQRSAATTVDNILAYLSGTPKNVLNPEALNGPRQHRPVS
jgi:phosphoglycerate dehydrogenase-like enzyme